ncbi:IS3 family transposase, partial [Streptomyces otsuchiensis]|uniref:IS3 family transposase n=1 Tax=Streptomyces otsuchiensis TaxID=2681388 RepID=UPI0013002086
VDPVCRVLELSPSTYFARRTRPKSARRLRDEELIPMVTAAWEDSGRTYGVRRVTRALVRAGHAVARCTVERLMRELGIEGVIRGQRRRTTVPEPTAPRPPDLVNRRFTAEARPGTRPSRSRLRRAHSARRTAGRRQRRPPRRRPQPGDTTARVAVARTRTAAPLPRQPNIATTQPAASLYSAERSSAGRRR